MCDSWIYRTYRDLLINGPIGNPVRLLKKRFYTGLAATPDPSPARHTISVQTSYEHYHRAASPCKTQKAFVHKQNECSVIDMRKKNQIVPFRERIPRLASLSATATKFRSRILVQNDDQGPAKCHYCRSLTKLIHATIHSVHHGAATIDEHRSCHSCFGLSRTRSNLAKANMVR
jgi:hypothetical protein